MAATLGQNLTATGRSYGVPRRQAGPDSAGRPAVLAMAIKTRECGGPELTICLRCAGSEYGFVRISAASCRLPQPVGAGHGRGTWRCRAARYGHEPPLQRTRQATPSGRRPRARSSAPTRGVLCNIPARTRRRANRACREPAWSRRVRQLSRCPSRDQPR